MGRKLDREDMEVHLDTLSTLLMDLFHLKLGRQGGSITNADAAERLTRIAESVSLDFVINWAGKIEELLKGMTRNLNRTIAMEAMLISL